MPSQRKVLFSAGDPSGDLLAAQVASRLKSKYGPACQIWAIGGPNLKKTADVFIEDLTHLGLMGWLDPLKRIPYILSVLKKFKNIVQDYHFDCFVPVDFYGLNIRFARKAKKRGIPVIYYVSPQVWASRESRISKIRQVARKMLCLFPFEENLYLNHNVPARFVGHPLAVKLKNIKPSCSPKIEQLSIGLLPGSRKNEVLRHLPLLLDVWAKIRGKIPAAQAYLFKCEEIARVYPSDNDLQKQGIAGIWGPDYGMRKSLDFSITASGMAALENTILAVPMVVFYSVKPAWFYELLKRFVKTPYIAIPNILAQSPIVEEFHWGDSRRQRKEAALKIFQASLRLLQSPTQREELAANLDNISQMLLPPNNEDPSDLVVHEIEETFHDKLAPITALS